MLNLEMLASIRVSKYVQNVQKLYARKATCTFKLRELTGTSCGKLVVQQKRCELKLKFETYTLLS